MSLSSPSAGYRSQHRPFTAIAGPDITGPVGREAANDRQDVINAQVMLANAGYLDLAATGGPTGWPGSELVRALTRFQRDHGATPDGLLLPEGFNDDPRNGETLRLMQEALGGRLDGFAIPTPDQVDRHHAGPDAAAGNRITVTADPGRGLPAGVVMPEDERQVLTDADDGDPMPLQPDRQYAQTVLPVSPPPALAAGAGAALPAGTPPVVVSPDHDRAGAMLERALGNTVKGIDALQDRHDRAMDRIVPGLGTAAKIVRQTPQIINLLTQPDNTAFKPTGALPPLPPSEPMSERDRALTQTPPSEPVQIDMKHDGLPAEPVEPYIEKLIPPELKLWVDTRPPHEQPFAKDLIGIILEYNEHGIRGKPETVKANRIAAKACMDTLQEYPRLTGIAHVRGGYKDGNSDAYLKEIITKPGSGSLLGSSRPDLSFINEIVKSYAARFNTVDILKAGSENEKTYRMTANEQRRYDKLLSNIREGVAGWARKMFADEDEAHYRSYVEERCHDMWQRLEVKLENDGVLPPRR